MKITMKEKSDTVQHYWRMWEWVRSQPPSDRASPDVMSDAINENWMGDHCPLCVVYFNSSLIGCANCPLSGIDESCGHHYSLWYELNNSSTWAEWLINFELMVKAITNLEVRK